MSEKQLAERLYEDLINSYNEFSDCSCTGHPTDNILFKDIDINLLKFEAELLGFKIKYVKEFTNYKNIFDEDLNENEIICYMDDRLKL